MTEARDAVWAIVPAKSFQTAKSRLAGVLSQAERAVLAEAMLSDVLTVLKMTPEVANTIVVSSCRRVRDLAQSFGASVIEETEDAGTNAAVTRGVEHLRDAGVGRCLIVLGDLPYLTVAEMQAAVRAMQDADMVLVPSRGDGGTNMLGLAQLEPALLAFGKDSRAAHLRAAVSFDLRVRLLRLAGASHDIDVPRDLEPAWYPAGPATAAVLARISKDTPAGRPANGPARLEEAVAL